MENLKFRIIGALLFLLFLQYPDSTFGQQVIEIHGGIGYTSVDLEAWAGTEPNEWDQTMSQIEVQYFFSQVGDLTIGVELGYQYFFWYEVVIPFGSTRLFRGRWAEANHLMAIGRYEFNDKLYADVGLGMIYFEDWTDIGLSGALGYRFRANEKLAVPVKFKAGLVLDNDANLIPLGITIGLAYKM